MRILAQILLIVLFVILFLAELISTTLKFTLLNYNFWEISLQKYSVYQSLTDVSKSSFESQIDREGGNKNDIKFLTDLITPENTKDVVNRNLRYFLDFANGMSSQINVYLPIEKVPSNILPKNLLEIKSEMPLFELFAKFNFQGWQDLPLQNLSNVGKVVTYLFVGLSSLLVFLIISLVFLVERGKRFISLGIGFIFCGGLTFLLISITTNLNMMLSKSLVNNSSIALVILGTILSPVITEIMFAWKIVGLIIFILGFGLFFVKKPTYNNSK